MKSFRKIYATKENLIKFVPFIVLIKSVRLFFLSQDTKLSDLVSIIREFSKYRVMPNNFLLYLFVVFVHMDSTSGSPPGM